MSKIEVSFPGGKQVHAHVGNFVIETDQSPKAGGQGTAPEPFDLFLASIASCAGVFALNFCHARDLSTAGLGLSLEIAERDPKRKLITRMVLHLRLPRGFPEKYRAGIRRATELCAVKRHLREAPEFQVRIEE